MKKATSSSCENARVVSVEVRVADRVARVAACRALVLVVFFLEKLLSSRLESRREREEGQVSGDGDDGKK